MRGKAFCSWSVRSVQGVHEFLLNLLPHGFIWCKFGAWYLPAGVARVSCSVLTFPLPPPITFLGTLESTQMTACSWLGDGGYWCCNQNLKWPQRDFWVWICVEYVLVCFSVPHMLSIVRDLNWPWAGTAKVCLHVLVQSLHCVKMAILPLHLHRS